MTSEQGLKSDGLEKEREYATVAVIWAYQEF